MIGFNTDRSDSRVLCFQRVLRPLTSDRDSSTPPSTGLRQVTARLTMTLLQIVEKVFRDKPKEEFRGRRALVALTDGVDSTSSVDFAVGQGRARSGRGSSLFSSRSTRVNSSSRICSATASSPSVSPAAQIQTVLPKFRTQKRIWSRRRTSASLAISNALPISKKLYEIADSEMDDLPKARADGYFPSPTSAAGPQCLSQRRRRDRHKIHARLLSVQRKKGRHLS